MLTLALLASVLSAVQVSTAQALLPNYRVFGWGTASTGRLADGQSHASFVNRLSPTEIEYLSELNATRGIARFYHFETRSFVITGDGAVYTWGQNSMFSLGLGFNSVYVAEPTFHPYLTNLHNARGIAEFFGGGLHSFVATNDGRIYGWGSSGNGQLGRGNQLTAETPVEITNLTNINSAYATAQGGGIVSLYPRGDTNLLLTRDGTVYAWGSTADGLLGTPWSVFALRIYAPTAIPEINNVGAARDGIESLHAGTEHAFIITGDGAVYGWGRNGFGQLGRGNTAGPQQTPVEIANLTNINATYGIAQFITNWHGGGGQHNFLITNCGVIYGWGRNDLGQLGRGNTINATAPVAINQLNALAVTYATAENGGIVYFHIGINGNIIVTANGAVYKWGDNSFGNHGRGNTTSPISAPLEVPALTELVRDGRRISFTGTHSFALIPFAATSNFPLHKHLQKPEGTPAPNLTFTFTVERNSFNGNTTPADIARIPEIAPITLSPTTVVSPPPPPAGTVTLRAYTDILDGIVFTEVGIYSWTVSEVQSATGIGPDSTVVFSQAQYDLRVYVFREPGPLGNYYVRYITLHRIQNADGTTPTNGREKVDDLIFVNLYSYDPFITPTGLFLRSGSLYLVVFAAGVVLTTYLSLRARKRIEELPIMQ